MSSDTDYFTLEGLQEIKSQIEWYGADLNHFKTEELSTLEVSKDIGCSNREAWLSDGIQAGQSFQNKFGSGRPLHYVAGMLQWGKVYGRETSYVGLYYMLNKVFVAVDTKKKQACISYVSTMEKIYSSPSKLLVRGPSPYLLPITMMHQVMRVGGGNTTADASIYCSRCLELVMSFCQAS